MAPCGSFEVKVSPSWGCQWHDSPDSIGKLRRFRYCVMNDQITAASALSFANLETTCVPGSSGSAGSVGA